MRAWLSRDPGGPQTLQLAEIDDPRPGPGEVLVSIDAVGVNFPDGLLIRDLYQVKPPRPLIPGSEYCGVVKAIGEGVTRVSPDDVVIGSCGWGAMADLLVVAEDRCTRIPASLPRATAATFMFAYATAYHALVDLADLQPNQTVVVLGAAGGVGAAAVDLASAIGATVIACASSEEKVGFARDRGAQVGYVYDAHLQPGDKQKALSSALKELAPSGADVVLDPVGGAYAEPALRALGRGGKHLVVGFTAGVPRIPLNLPLLKGCQIIGVDWRTFVRSETGANARNVESLMAMWRSGQITPAAPEIFEFAHAPAAIARLESRAAVGKIAVTVRPIE